MHNKEMIGYLGIDSLKLFGLYLDPSPTSMMNLFFAKLVNSFIKKNESLLLRSIESLV